MGDAFEVFLHNYRLSSARRNDIAHGMSYFLFETAGEEEKCWYLINPFYSSGHRGDVWALDDIKLRAKKGISIEDKDAKSAFNKMAYKNALYVYGVDEIKTIAGKFAYLYTDLLAFLGVMKPKKAMSPETLAALAKAMSD